jgi:DNA-directed RNA polymerase subunit RPC12/RpoP
MDYICPSCGERYTKKKLDELEEKYGPVCPNCNTRECFISTPVVPSWRRYEHQINTPEGADKFIKEREHQVKTDPQMAKWEKSRKNWFQKQKHNWRNKEIKKLEEKGL